MEDESVKLMWKCLKTAYTLMANRGRHTSDCLE